jgi:acetyltransferase-like isoleucine patch superfamily enzyme
MAYLSREKLEAFGFKRLGKNVKVSDRAAIYNSEEIELGDHARIDDFCVVSGRVVMGRNTFVGVNSTVAGGTTGIFFEDFSAVSYGVRLLAQSDDYTGLAMTGPSIPARFRQDIKKIVRLERHVVVGAGAVVLPGVTLAEGTAVGAMALVTKSTEPWSIYAGVPARRLRARSRQMLDLEKQYLAEEGGV